MSIFATNKLLLMLVTFDKEYLKELYVSGKCSDKKHRFQPDVIKRYKRCIDTLIASKNAESLYKHNSLNYEVLVGDKEGLSSIRVTSKYRIEFTVRVVADAETIISICNVIELSNHYESGEPYILRFNNFQFTIKNMNYQLSINSSQWSSVKVEKGA